MKTTHRHAAPSQERRGAPGVRGLLSVTAAVAMMLSGTMLAVAATGGGQSPERTGGSDAAAPGWVKWGVVTSEGAPLGGTVWDVKDASGKVVVAQVEDCDEVATEGAEPCADRLDQSPGAGSFQVKDLPLGDYALVQTAAPEGSVKAEQPVQVSLTQGQPGFEVKTAVPNAAQSAPEDEDKEALSEQDGKEAGSGTPEGSGSSEGSDEGNDAAGAQSAGNGNEPPIILDMQNLLSRSARGGPSLFAASGTVSTGTIQAQVTNLSGGGDYRLAARWVGATYTYPAPAPSNGPSGWVGSNGQAFGGHGASRGAHSGDYIRTSMSSVGITPAPSTTVSTGTPFLLGQTTHYNYPISGSGNSTLTGQIQLRLAGFENKVLPFPWELLETVNEPPSGQNCANGRPNHQGINSNGCADRITFNSQISETNLVKDGVTYRLLVEGFFPATGSSCPSEMPPSTQNVFWTAEKANTTACIYGSLSQVRSLQVRKAVTDLGSITAIPGFPFSSTSNLAGSPWRNKAFTLTPTASAPAPTTGDILESRETVTVTEAAPNGWQLKDVVCTGTNEHDEVNVTGGKLTVTSSFDLDSTPIICTFTNAPIKGTATWSKMEQGTTSLLAGSAWTLKGPGASGPSQEITDCVAGSPAQCTGLDKDPAAGKFRVVALDWGQYTLTESAPPPGYEPVSGAAKTFNVTSSNRDIAVGSIYNKKALGSVVWEKVGESDDLLGGSVWTLTPTDPARTPVDITDCVAGPCSPAPGGAPFDSDPVAGQFKLGNLAWGTYTLVEKTPPAGYTGSSTVHTIKVGTASPAKMEWDLGSLENTQEKSSVAWDKVAAGNTEQFLGGSKWTITGPGYPAGGTEFEDCVAAGCAGPDMDPAAGRFLLENLAWGTYSVEETGNPPGYTGSASFEFTINADNAGTLVVPDGSPFTNDQREGPALPLTGGQSAALFTAIGLVAVGGAVGAALLMRRRRNS